jgi:hypothetical protein
MPFVVSLNLMVDWTNENHENLYSANVIEFTIQPP